MANPYHRIPATPLPPCNYLFDARVLPEALEEAHEHGYNDFGSDVLPRLPDPRRLYACDFTDNHVPGLKPCEEVGLQSDCLPGDSLRSP